MREGVYCVVCSDRKSVHRERESECMCVCVDQGFPTQLHHWAKIFVSILKRAAKLIII